MIHYDKLVHGFFVYPSSCTVHEQGYMTCER